LEQQGSEGGLVARGPLMPFLQKRSYKDGIIERKYIEKLFSRMVWLHGTVDTFSIEFHE
jgi:hypothetical protein